MYTALTPEQLSSYWHLDTYSLIDSEAFPLYKGMTSSQELKDFYFCEPSLSKRESKTLNENGNTYNLLLNNLPSWQILPRRENSIITTTELRTAESFSRLRIGTGHIYSKIYKVIPKQNSDIAIASSDDIWTSFRVGLGELGLRGLHISLVNFNLCLKEIFNNIENGYEYENSWDDLTNNLYLLASEKLNPIRSKLSIQSENILNHLIFERERVFEYLDNVFSPLKNNIKMEVYNSTLSKNDYINREIWTSSSCILIDVEKNINNLRLE